MDTDGLLNHLRSRNGLMTMEKNYQHSRSVFYGSRSDSVLVPDPGLVLGVVPGRKSRFSSRSGSKSGTCLVHGLAQGLTSGLVLGQASVPIPGLIPDPASDLVLGLVPGQFRIQIWFWV